MKKKPFILAALGLIAMGGIGAVSYAQATSAPVQIVLAEEEPVEPEPEEIKNTVVVAEGITHGNITTDIIEGNVGDIVTVNAKADMFYLVGSVEVNGIALIESESTIGEFKFALAEGENIITATFILDRETLGEFADIYVEIENKDWANVFSLRNVLTIVGWLLDGGLILAMVRYFVKDKKLEKKLEKTTKETIEEIIPESTKNTVVATVESVFTPLMSNLGSEMVEMKRAMGVFAKCLALQQENSPEARQAVINELMGLKIGDMETIGQVKAYIEDLVARSEKTYHETMEALNNISANNKQIIENVEAVEVKQEEPKDNGTVI